MTEPNEYSQLAQKWRDLDLEWGQAYDRKTCAENAMDRLSIEKLEVAKQLGERVGRNIPRRVVALGKDHCLTIQWRENITPHIEVLSLVHPESRII